MNTLFSKRYRPSVEWSSSWIYNAFRCFEFLFGRKSGIRLEQIVNGKTGEIWSFTWENYLATWEGIIRASFKEKLAFRIIYIPQFKLADIADKHQGQIPFRFAIAFDTAQIKQSDTVSWSHTVTGSNPYILVAEDQNQNVSGIKYNGVSLVQQAQVTGNGSWDIAGVWGLGAPSTGANTVVITTSGAGFYSGSISYSGCQSTTPADNTGTALQTTSTSNLSLTFSSVADNCWQIAWFQSADTAISIVTGTSHTTGGDGFELWADTNAVIHPAGSTTLTVHPTGSSRIIAAGVTIAPFGSVAATNSNFLMFIS